MKFAIPQSQMLNVLAQITGVLERSQTRDILSHARVNVTETGDLTVSCTDLTMTIVARLNLEQVEEPGGASIPGLRLFDIFRTLPRDADVTFETVEDLINITAGRSAYRLNVMTGPNSAVLDGYVASPPDDHVEIKVPAGHLRKQLLYTNPVMGLKEARRYMVATCFELTSDYMRTISTEASMLAMATISQGVDTLDEMRQYVVPRKTVLQVTSMCAAAGASDEVTLTFGTNHFSATIGVFTLTSNLMDTKFPDYHNVFPSEMGWRMVCDREAMRTALEQVEVVAVDTSHRIFWESADDVLQMKAASTRNDRVETEVALESLASARKMAVNGEKMLLLISSLAEEKIEFISASDDEKANIKLAGVPLEGDGEPAGGNPVEVTYLMATMSDR